MRRFRNAILAAVFFAGGLVGAATAVLPTSASFRLPALWLGGAGGSAASSSYKNTAAAAQPVSGAAASASFRLTAGFGGPLLGVVRKTVFEKLVDPTRDSVLFVDPPSGRITVEIPAGTFSETVTVTVRVATRFATLTSNIARLKGTDIGVEITNDLALQPRRPVTLTFRYRDADIAGMEPSRLRVARYVENEGRWLPLSTTVDASNRRLTAQTAHLSVFRVIEMVPGASVGDVFVFPNPLRPDHGHTAMNFTNLPSDAEIRIYTLAGDLVRELRPDAAGGASWDGKNESGEKAASGVYLALLKQGSDAKTVKVAVQR